MELIKKIKQAEAQAQKIIDQAKAETVRQAEQAQEKRRQALNEAKQQRKRAIEAAASDAQSQSVGEIEKLKAQAETQRRQLRDKAGGKMPAAVDRVIKYINPEPGRNERANQPKMTPCSTPAD